MPRTRLVAIAFFAAFAFTSQLGAQVFFAEDLDGSTTTRSAFTNSMAAETLFLNMLVGVGTEDFEGFTVGTGTPLPINFTGAGTATLTGAGDVSSAPIGGTNGFGRYGKSEVNFWEVVVGGPTAFSIAFTQPIAAFGFYGIDVGDFGGMMSLSFLTGGGPVAVPVNHTVGASGNPDGAAFFFGYINVLNPFTNVEFLFNDPTGGIDADVFAFDNLTIGTVEQVVPGVPEPMTVVLLATGLIGIAAIRPRLGNKVEDEEE